MSELFPQDDFTIEVKKFFIESVLGHVEKYLLVLKEGNWADYHDQIREFFDTTIRDSETNELKDLSVFTQTGVQIFSELNFQRFYEYLTVFADYLRAILESPSEQLKLYERFSAQLKKVYHDLFLICYIGSHQMLISAKSILEIMSYSTVSELPSKSTKVLGLMSARGEIVSILNPAAFGLSFVEPSQRKFLILFKGKNELLALPFESTDRLIEVDTQKLKKTALPKASVQEMTLIEEIVVLDSRTTLLLNLEDMDL